MWSQTYTKTFAGVSAADVWNVWSDVDRWREWQDDLECAKLEGDFCVGSMFRLKPKGGPNVKIDIVRCDPQHNFTDRTKFPLARMYGCHDLIERDGALELKTTVTVEGPLAFLWRRIVAEGVVASLPAQTDALVARAKALAGGAQ